MRIIEDDSIDEEFDTDDADSKAFAARGRERQCALRRETLPIERLVRFVLSPEGVVVPDIRCKLPGRGLWLTAQREAIAQAAKRNVFSRGFRTQASAPADLPELVAKLLRKDAANALSLANKAGLVITGYEKIKDAIGKGRVAWLLHARDAAASGRERLDRLMAATTADKDTGEQGSPVLPVLFDAEELSLALGRVNVIHIGLKQGEAAQRFQLALSKAVAFGPIPQDDAR